MVGWKYMVHQFTPILQIMELELKSYGTFLSGEIELAYTIIKVVPQFESYMNMGCTKYVLQTTIHKPLTSKTHHP